MVQRQTEDSERAEGIASEGGPANPRLSQTDATSPPEGLREAVEWLSVKDTRRMIKHGSPSGVYRSFQEHRPDNRRRVQHHRVLAETEPAEVLGMCDLVEQEGTSGPDIFQLIDAQKQGRVLVRPHDVERSDGRPND